MTKKLLVAGAALLSLVGAAAAPTQGSAPSGAAAASNTARKPAAPKTVLPQKPAPKIWTLEDLEKLRQASPGAVQYLEFPEPAVAAEPMTPGQVPAGVSQRYQELIAEADAEIASLEKERLAASNPLLAGLAGRKARPLDVVDADLTRWRQRRGLAEGASSHAASADADQGH
jgi:hypothetical protein